ncbi:MAG: mannanase, partial [Proteobacteria bacterium]|nr:mannanase [Pseudomonadota bacterium]
FYTYPAAITAYHTHIKTMVNRRNSISDRYYRDDPTIMAWELANEPEESEDRPAFVRWIAESAALIKDLDPKHLVISGSEGPSFEEVNRLKQIDYATIHIWPQNAGWYDPLQHQKTYAEALNRALQNIEQHIKITASLNKPLVLAEFGLARDLNNFDPRSSTEARDHFFATVFERVYASARLGQSLAGSNFWAWAGEGRRQSWGKYWRPGDQLIGDPPHEQQGWYSVFDSDASSLALIKEYAGKMDLE